MAPSIALDPDIPDTNPMDGAIDTVLGPLAERPDLIGVPPQVKS